MPVKGLKIPSDSLALESHILEVLTSLQSFSRRCGLLGNFHSQVFHACSSWSSCDWSKTSWSGSCNPNCSCSVLCCWSGVSSGRAWSIEKLPKVGCLIGNPLLQTASTREQSGSCHSRAELPRQERFVPPIKENSTILKGTFMT